MHDSKASPPEAPPAPRLCTCICWICSLDVALPLGQEALISCVGGGWQGLGVGGPPGHP